MANRTVRKNTRLYVDGYDLSTNGLALGPLSVGFDYEADAAYADPIMGGLPGQCTPNISPLSAIFDTTASVGAHEVMKNADVMRTVLIAIGMSGAPAEGDPAFMGEFEQGSYIANVAGGLVTADMTFNPSARGTTLAYERFWGPLLHEKSAETAANDQTGVDDHEAQTAKGGFMVYQLVSSNGTCTLKVQDAATNSDGNFSDLASSGSIDASAAPVSALVALARDATVERYLRWQIALGTATTATFALGFVRAIR